MGGVGSSAAPTAVAFRNDATQQQQGGTVYFPESGEIHDLGAWIAGLTGGPPTDVRLCVWDPTESYALVGYSDPFTLSNAPASVANLERATHPLVAPLHVLGGTEMMLGFASDTKSGSGLQWGIRSNPARHRARDLALDAPWPDSMASTVTYDAADQLAAWVESFEADPLPVTSSVWPTLEELKAELGVTSSSSDAVLQRSLDAAVEQVVADCGGAPVPEPSASQSQAALILAVMVAKAPAAPYGVAAVFDAGALRVSATHPTYLRLLSGQRSAWPIA